MKWSCTQRIVSEWNPMNPFLSSVFNYYFLSQKKRFVKGWSCRLTLSQAPSCTLPLGPVSESYGRSAHPPPNNLLCLAVNLYSSCRHLLRDYAGSSSIPWLNLGTSLGARTLYLLTPSSLLPVQPQISGTVVKILISNGFEVEVERVLGPWAQPVIFFSLGVEPWRYNPMSPR